MTIDVANAAARRQWETGLAMIEPRKLGDPCIVCNRSTCPRKRVMVVGHFEPGPCGGLRFVAKGRGHSWKAALDAAGVQ